MNSEDIPRILELEDRLFDNALAETQLLRELEVGYGKVFCKDGASDRPIGYMLVRPDRDVLDLTRLAVDPAAQGTGVGTLLLQSLYRDAQNMQRDVILTVLKNNRNALRLYLKHGFRVVGNLSGCAWVLRREGERGPAWGPEVRPAASPCG